MWDNVCVWELKLDPVKKHQVLLTVEPSLQPLVLSFSSRFFAKLCFIIVNSEVTIWYHTWNCITFSQRVWVWWFKFVIQAVWRLREKNFMLDKYYLSQKQISKKYGGNKLKDCVHVCKCVQIIILVSFLSCFATCFTRQGLTLV